MRHLARQYSVTTMLLLLLSIVGSAVWIGLVAQTGRFPYVACVGLVPLFVAVRRCRPLGALLAGTTWGLSFYALSVIGLGPTVSPTGGSLLLLVGTPAVYAWLGALLTRWIGFSPFVIAVGWMGVELALSPLGFNAGVAGAPSTDAGGVLHWIAQAQGYVLVAFGVAYVNAALVFAFGGARLPVPRFVPRMTSSGLRRLLSPQSMGCLSRFALQPSRPRGPPLFYRATQHGPVLLLA